jgi:hypothetical protein
MSVVIATVTRAASSSPDAPPLFEQLHYCQALMFGSIDRRIVEADAGGLR